MPLIPIIAIFAVAAVVVMLVLPALARVILSIFSTIAFLVFMLFGHMVAAIVFIVIALGGPFIFDIIKKKTAPHITGGVPVVVNIACYIAAYPIALLIDGLFK